MQGARSTLGLRGLLQAHTPPETQEAYSVPKLNQVSSGLEYYRCERIIQDIAEFCAQILMTDEGGEGRQEGLQQLTW